MVLWNWGSSNNRSEMVAAWGVGLLVWIPGPGGRVVFLGCWIARISCYSTSSYVIINIGVMMCQRGFKN